jgi:glycosyltransferase involved in cell wall biosynthesis
MKLAVSKVKSRRIAFVVSHPVQYYAPLYRRLAGSMEVRVFFTWHGGGTAVVDHGFGKSIAWDIPLTEGYNYEVVPNTSRSPGSHHFWGLKNPELGSRVFGWKPDVVHITGYSYASHLGLMHACYRRGVTSLFRGDSHLLDQQHGIKWVLKKQLLKQIFRWPSAFLCVGTHNRDYYKAFGVPNSRLFDCPHSIDVDRFAGLGFDYDQKAAVWRNELGIVPTQKTVLFAGKFEPKKRPVEFMRCFLKFVRDDTILIMVGDGQLGSEVRHLASLHPQRIRVLPFQNQQQMPVVYRLGHVFVLPSGWGETWGLAVNEALSSGRRVLVSDRVGCATDVVHPGINGDVFRMEDWSDCGLKLNMLLSASGENRSAVVTDVLQGFSFSATESALTRCLSELSLAK